jgi:hypothetical protein
MSVPAHVTFTLETPLNSQLSLPITTLIMLEISLISTVSFLSYDVTSRSMSRFDARLSHHLSSLIFLLLSPSLSNQVSIRTVQYHCLERDWCTSQYVQCSLYLSWKVKTGVSHNRLSLSLLCVLSFQGGAGSVCRRNSGVV